MDCRQLVGVRANLGGKLAASYGSTWSCRAGRVEREAVARQASSFARLPLRWKEDDAGLGRLVSWAAAGQRGRKGGGPCGRREEELGRLGEFGPEEKMGRV